MRGRVLEIGEEGRPTCYACYRPTGHCICSLLSPFDAHTCFLLLQHPNEWRKHHSTVRILRHAIRNMKYLRGVVFDQELLNSHIRGRRSFLLYPGKDACPAEQIALGTDDLVVVVDGTWDEAGKIVFRNPLLKGLPRISFSEIIPSNYRIRREPKEGCLSTLESVAYMLKANATAQGIPSDRYDSLLEAFNTMVDRHLAYFPRMRNAVMVS